MTNAVRAFRCVFGLLFVFSEVIAREGDTMSKVPFYNSHAWRSKRKEILKKYNGECQICKANGRYSRAVIVHHVFHLAQYPHWGLDEFVNVNGEKQQNLVPVCRACHETVCHPERMRSVIPQPPLTVERW